jgi:hypothetical protein
MAQRKIKVTYDPPPIPWRGADFTATYEDYDLGDPIGVGETEEEAVADFKIESDYYDDDEPEYVDRQALLFDHQQDLRKNWEP